MAGEPDDSGSYLLFNYAEVVIYFPKTVEGPPPTTGGITVGNALREIIEKQTVGPGGSILRSTSVNWHLPDAQLNGTIPKFGDVVQDANDVRYTITESLNSIRFDSRVYRIWVVPSRQEQ